MEYFVSLTAIHQIRYDKPNILLDQSVPEYMQIRKKEKELIIKNRAELMSILTRYTHRSDWMVFGSKPEFIRVMSIILNEICVEEMGLAITRFHEKGIKKCITYLLSCCE